MTASCACFATKYHDEKLKKERNIFWNNMSTFAFFGFAPVWFNKVLKIFLDELLSKKITAFTKPDQSQPNRRYIQQNTTQPSPALE